MRVFFLMLGLAVFFPLQAFAGAIGISQSTVDTVVYRGDILHESFVVSRSDTDRDFLFNVVHEGSPLIDVHGQDHIVIPSREDTAVFWYTLDASSADVGEYDARIRFILDPAHDASVEADHEGALVQYGLTATVHVAVVERPDASVTLIATEYPTLMDDVVASTPTVRRTKAVDGTMLSVAWNVENRGQNPLLGIPSEIIITERGMVQYREVITTIDPVSPQAALTQTTNFFVSDRAASGRYRVTVATGESTATAAVWIVQPRLFYSLLTVVLGILFSGVAIAMHGRLRSRR